MFVVFRVCAKYKIKMIETAKFLKFFFLLITNLSEF